MRGSNAVLQAQRFGDFAQQIILAHRFIRRDAQNTPSIFPKIIVANLVALLVRLKIVNGAVDLNDEAL